MSFLSYIRREYIVRMRWGLAGTISRARRGLAGKKLFTNCNAFSFPWVANYWSVSSIELIWADRQRDRKKNVWSSAEEKDFLLLYKEKQIADLLDKCVTSAGVSRSLFKYSL